MTNIVSSGPVNRDRHVLRTAHLHLPPRSRYSTGIECSARTAHNTAVMLEPKLRGHVETND
jgi:hypothetical protein